MAGMEEKKEGGKEDRRRRTETSERWATLCGLMAIGCVFLRMCVYMCVQSGSVVVDKEMNKHDPLPLVSEIRRC